MAKPEFLREQLLDLQVKADELDAENIRLGKENAKYEVENKRLRTSITDLKDQLLNTVDRKELEELSNKFENLEEKFKNLDKNYKLVKKENETLDNTLAHCQENYEQLEIKCETYKKENIELKSNIGELKSISKQTLEDATNQRKEVEKQTKLINALEEENESLKTHLNYLKEQNRKNVSIAGDSFSFDQFNGSISAPESMDIIVETKLRDCQKQLEETKSELIAKQQELDEQAKQMTSLNNAKIEQLTNELNEFANAKSELEDCLKTEIEEKVHQLDALHEEMKQIKQDYEMVNCSLLDREEKLKLSIEEQDKLRQINIANQTKVEELESEIKRLVDQIAANEEKRSRLQSEFEITRTQNIEEQKSQIDKLINEHREELEQIRSQADQKLATLTSELSRQEDEQMKLHAHIDELNNKYSDLQSNYDQLMAENHELMKSNEEKDNKLIDSESEKLNLELKKYDEEIKRIQECLESTADITLAQSTKLAELENQKEVITVERDELANQVVELQSALDHARDEYSVLAKQHQQEIFKLSEAMNKKQDDSKLQADLQNVFKELKGKENELNALRVELEKSNEQTQLCLIKIEKLKANDREKNHSMYMLKQQIAEQQKNMKKLELMVKKIEADKTCAEDSFALERATKERYYHDLTQLERRVQQCSECTKLERSNSITFNARDQTLIVRNASNPNLIQKIPTNVPNKYFMEDEEGQFMTNSQINDIRKRKTEHDSEDEFKKRLNILQQRNAQLKPHLKTSYALEFQEVGEGHLNEKIKNSEKFFVGDENARNPLSRKPQFSSQLRFRKP